MMEGNNDHIDKRTLRYEIVRSLLARPAFNLFFYKKLQVIGKDQIPFGHPLIFALNHQCALMDALAVVLNAGWPQNVFLARADIFKVSWQAKMLHIFKIMPIYRIRDGAEEVRKNEEIFQTLLGVLRRKHGIAIMPEGSHAGIRRIRPLVKGIFRIAFKAQEEAGTEETVKIVPVGLDYSHYTNFRTRVLVIYGPPIDVLDFYEDYLQEPAVTVNRFRNRLREEMKRITIHIDTDEFYDLYMGLRILYNRKMRDEMKIGGRSLYDKFLADKEMIRLLDLELESNPQTLKEMNLKYTELNGMVETLDFRLWMVPRKKFSAPLLLLESLVLLLGLPIYVLGFTGNIIPYSIPIRMTRKVRDPQFITSFRIVLGIIVFAPWYLLLTILGMIFIHPWWIGLCLLVAVPAAGLITFDAYIGFRKLRSKWRHTFLRWRKDPRIRIINELYQEITRSLDRIVQKHRYP